MAPQFTPPQRDGDGTHRLGITGVLFPEETAWRRLGDGWVFHVHAKSPKIQSPRREGMYFARAGRAGRQDLAQRVPELLNLSQRTIAVVGLGGIGAPSALEFARAGTGELRVLDHDVVEPGTGVRWPRGFQAAGLPKTVALEQLITAEYPYTKVVPYLHRIGGARFHDDIASGPSDLVVLDQLLDGVDLVYDATAEVGVNHLLADLARERRIPYLCVAATPGAWGGMIVRVRPGVTAGCWSCFWYAEADGTLPVPAQDPAGGVQPVGCANPTFTGSSFDIAQVALMGVRLGVGTLTESAPGSYPDANWDVAIGSLRAHNGAVITPQWHTSPLDRHPDCRARHSW